MERRGFGIGLLLAAALLAPPAARAATLHLSGARCGGFVRAGAGFEVRGTAEGLPAGNVVALKAAFLASGMESLRAVAAKDFSLLPPGLADALTAGPVTDAAGFSFGSITAGDGAPTSAAMALFELRLQVPEGATGRIEIAPSPASRAAFADREIPLAPGAACAVEIGEGPVADAGPDLVMNEGETALLDGSASADGAGEANLAYRWEILEGAALLGRADDAAAFLRAYRDAGGGVARVRLTVTDPDTGASDADEAEIAIADVPAVCTDADGDGWFAEGGDCGPADCADDDPAINPGITRKPQGEIPESCLRAAECGTLSASGGVQGALAALLAYGAPLLVILRGRRLERARRRAARPSRRRAA